MNTREMSAGLRLPFWAGIIRKREESGLSVKAFCEKEGICPNSYFYWQKKLRETACTQIAGTAPAGFIEVKIPELASPPPLGRGELRIEAAGLRISADSWYPADQIAVLLRGVLPC